MEAVHSELYFLNATASKPSIYFKSSLHIHADITGLSLALNRSSMLEACTDLFPVQSGIPMSFYGDKPEVEFFKKETLKQREQKIKAVFSKLSIF